VLLAFEAVVVRAVAGRGLLRAGPVAVVKARPGERLCGPVPRVQAGLSVGHGCCLAGQRKTP